MNEAECKKKKSVKQKIKYALVQRVDRSHMQAPKAERDSTIEVEKREFVIVENKLLSI